MKKLKLICISIYFLTIGSSLNAQIISNTMHLYITHFETNNFPHVTDTLNPWVIDTTYADNIWQIGKPNKILFDSAYTVPYAMVTHLSKPYPVNNHSTFQFHIKKPGWAYEWEMGWSNLTLMFFHKYNTDSLYDGGYIDISYDGGETFSNIIFDEHLRINPSLYSQSDTILGKISAYSGSSVLDWSRAEFTLYWEEEENYDVDSMIIRFNFKSDSIDNAKEGWMIDCIYLELIGYATMNVSNLQNNVIKLYPNPANKYLNIDIAQANIASSIEVFNVQATSVLKERIESGNTKLNVQHLAKGTYIVKILMHNNKTYYSRFLKL